MKKRNNVLIFTSIIFIVISLIAMAIGIYGIFGKDDGFSKAKFFSGLIYFLFFSLALFGVTQRTKMLNTLQKEGRRVMADIHEVIAKRVVRYWSYCIVCKWTDEKGDIHLIKSDPFTKYPELGDLKQLPVYVDRNDSTRFHVDPDAIPLEKPTPRKGEQCPHYAPIRPPHKATGINNHHNRIIFLIMDITMLLGFLGIYLIHLPAVSNAKLNPMVFAVMLSMFALMIGSGLLVNASILRKIFAPRKTKPALLVSVEKTAAYMDAAGESLFLLKFQDGQGKYYFFPVNDTRGYEEGSTYDLTIKAKKVINVGARSYQRVIPQKIKTGYWSGIYAINEVFNARQRKKSGFHNLFKREWIKYENPFALMLNWLLFIIFIMVLLILILSVYEPIVENSQLSRSLELTILIGFCSFIAIGLAYYLIKDYICKRKEIDE